MVAPLLAAAGVGFVGNLLGGKSKSDAAKKQQRMAQKARDKDQRDLLRLRDKDQAEALALSRDDEARAQAAHKAGIGYDLKRLRDEAEAAGFNPLTVLQNTGAANYAVTPMPVMSSPFVARPFTPRLDSVLATGQARVDTAGYFGDAVSQGASAYIGISQEAARLAADREMAAAIRSERQPARPGAAPFAPAAKPIDERPVQGPRQPVRVNLNGTWQWLDAGAADRIGIADGETLVAEDIEALLGDVQSEIVLGADRVVNWGGPFYRPSSPPPVQGPPGPAPGTPSYFWPSSPANATPWRLPSAGEPQVYSPWLLN